MARRTCTRIRLERHKGQSSAIIRGHHAKYRQPLSLEKAVTPMVDESPPQRRRSSLLTKLSLLAARDMNYHDHTNAPTVYSESKRRGEDQPPDELRITVLIAMPSPSASTRQCGYTNLGVANIICEK